MFHGRLLDNNGHSCESLADLFYPVILLQYRKAGSDSGGEAKSDKRTKGEYATLLLVVLRTCTVAVKDIRDVEHSIEVTAETLYEAIRSCSAD